MAEGIDYFKSQRGNKPEYAYNVDRVWPKLMNHLKKHGSAETLEKMKEDAKVAVPRRKVGSVPKERPVDEPQEQVLDGFRPLGAIKGGGWD